MALYIGKERVTINLNGSKLKLHTGNRIMASVKLLSADNYILKDKDGLYLTAMNHATDITGVRLLSIDNYILKDINGLYLTVKEGE